MSYTSRVLFENFLGLKLQFCSDREFFKNAIQAKLNYSTTRIDNREVFIWAAPLLFEQTIVEQKIEIFEWDNLPAFFKADCDADLPFDVFALIFFLLSRYEEYLAFSPDQHGRFQASSSLAHRAGFLHLPLVDLWTLKLGHLLKKKFPQLVIGHRSYSFFPSFDIDMAWAFLHKGFLRSWGALASKLLSGAWSEYRLRRAVLRKKIPDPFYTFDKIEDWHRDLPHPPRLFLLLGRYGKYDKNNSVHSLAFQQLISRLAQKYALGIHPSYASNEDKRLISQEKLLLEKIIGTQVTSSRQHFLKLSFPHTYRNLVEAGIRSDYSMGFADHTGFRAGTAHPFPWYDLDKEEATDLLIHPFQVMDITLRKYMDLDPEAAVREIQELVSHTRAVHGNFISVWHNSSLSGIEGWQGWGRVYKKLLEVAN